MRGSKVTAMSTFCSDQNERTRAKSNEIVDENEEDAEEQRTSAVAASKSKSKTSIAGGVSTRNDVHNDLTARASSAMVRKSRRKIRKIKIQFSF